jgi:hypothetical protein
MSAPIQSKTGGYPRITATTTLDELVLAIAGSASTPSAPPDLSSPASANPAVARCCQAHALARKASLARDRSEYAANVSASNAYRNTLPPLSGSRNIRDFIACIAQAMLIQAIDGSEGARLLYAAQVASAAHNARSVQKSNKLRTKTPLKRDILQSGLLPTQA